MKHNKEKIGKVIFLGFGSIAFIPLQICALIFSEKIKNKKHLEKLLNEEASKLGLNDKKILAKFNKKGLGITYCDKFNDGTYTIVLSDIGRNKSSLKHELYHIYKDDFKHKNPNRYFFIEEPRAVLYQTLGIKL